MAQLKDTVVAGSLRVTDTIYGDTIRLTAISAPTSSNGTTYGPGTNGYVIKSNGTSVYWASIGNASGYSVKDSTANSALGTGTGLTTERAVYYGLVTVNNASQTRATGIYAPTSAGTANQILVSAGGTAAPTWKATANGAAYATSSNGALTFGTLPVAQGGTGKTTAAEAWTALGGGASGKHDDSYFALASHGTHVTYGTSASAVGTTATAGSATTVSRSDHVHSIPIATADVSGIVTNDNQTFGGNKIFKGHVYPQATRTYTLGTSSLYWNGAYIYAGGTIHEANIYWGGSGGDMTTIYNTIDNNRGITAFRYPSYNFGNKTFGLSAESVTIEYTTNSGSSWAAVTNAWYSDDRKRNLFNYNDAQIPVGNLPKFDYGSSATTQAATVGMGVRVTADFEHENRIFNMSIIETYWRIYCCTCTCTIEMFDDYNDTWTTLWTDSYNNVDTRRYYHFGTDKVCDGARVNRAGRFHKLRWTIVVTAVGTSNLRYVPSISGLGVYGIGVPTFSTGSVTPSGGTATIFKHGSRFAWAMARWNTPIYAENYNKGGLGTARIPTTDLYIGDDMKYSAANTEKWSTLILGNEQNINDENTHSQGRICIYSAATKAHFIYGASTTTNYSHYLPNANGWIATGGDGSSSGVGDATHPVFLSTAGVLTACSGTLSLNAESATKTGASTIWMYPERGNEINFGGSNANTTIYFGNRAKDSRDIPAKFIFGGSTGTADLQVKTVYLGSGTSSYISSTEYTGNAATATKATQDNDGNQIDKSYLKRFAWWNANDSHDVDSLGNGMTFAYAAHNAPTTGTIVAFSCYNDAAYSFQLQSTFSNSDTLYYRSKNGDNDAWNTWKRVWLEGNSITSAVWNDYAEYRISDCNEPGKVVFEKGDDTLSETNQRLQHFAGVISDTWGFAQGKTKYAKTPLAVAGRVLVYPYRDRREYHPGDCVCAAPNGTVDIMTREEIALYPDRIVGIVSMVPSYEEWGGGDRPPVKVNNRIWIKVH